MDDKVLAPIRTLPRKSKIAGSLAATAIVGLLTLPGSMAAEIGHTASVKLRKWEMRPPAKSCLAKKYSVTVAGATYHLPAAPVVTIRAGKNSYHFQSNKSLREVCEKTPNSHDPIHSEDINLDLTIPLSGDFCKIAQGRWSKELCGHKPGATNDGYPTIANIYSPDEYDRKHLMSGHAHANFIDSRDKAIAAGHPFEPEQNGIFDHYPNGYWVAHTGAWTNDAGDPYTLHCQPSSQRKMLSCSTTYRLVTGPHITYHFEASANKLGDTARKIDRNIHQMLEEFAEP